MPRKRIFRMIRILMLATLVVIALPAYPKHPPGAPIDLAVWDWVLVPIYGPAPTPGAHGSSWSQRLTVYNGADIDLVFPANPCVSCPQTGLYVPARSTRELTLDAGGYWAGAGVLRWVNRNAVDQAAFSLTVFDMNAREASVSLPVLRSGDLHRETAQILNVAVAADLRSILRLYMATEQPGHFQGSYGFAVRVFRPVPSGADVLLAERTVTFTLLDFEDPTVFVRYAAITDLLTTVEPGHVRIEIEPLGHDVGFWAFIASVDNVTRDLSVQVPHK